MVETGSTFEASAPFFINVEGVPHPPDTKLDSDTLDKDTLDSLIPLFKKCKRKDLLPLLYFHTEESVSREIATYAYEKLQEDEETYYPFHLILQNY